MRRLALTLLTLALLGGTTAAFALTQRLKLERSPITGPKFDRLFSPRTGTATLALKLRRGDRVDAEIVDADGKAIRTLANDAEQPRGALTFRWDGRDDRGLIVPDGRYRLRIELWRQRRTILMPIPIRVDGTPPRASLLAARPRIFSPDGDGKRDHVVLLYRMSENARPVLVVRGVVVTRGQVRRAGRVRLTWSGKLGGRTVRRGTYPVWFRAVDPAGNRSERTEVVSLRVRYIELGRERFAVRRGGLLRFRVATDAERFRWTLVRTRRGSVRRAAFGFSERSLVAARLPRSVRPGRYVLRVTANGHSDRARVRVLPRR